MRSHVVHIITDDEDLTDPFSRTGDTHSWECSCGATEVRSPLAFINAAIHVRCNQGSTDTEETR
jgi:hypothetical protein